MKIHWIMLFSASLYVSDIYCNPSNSIFQFIRKIQVTPDSNFQYGASGYIHYVPGTNRFIVMLGTKRTKPPTDTTMQYIAYKEYDMDMKETNNWGILGDSPGDMTSRMAGNNLFVVKMMKKGDTTGWQLSKYDAIQWSLEKDIFIHLNFPFEQDGGPTVSEIGGKLDITGEYLADGTFEGKRASFHQILDTDLIPLGEKKYLTDTAHQPELSVIDVDNIYYVISGTSQLGNLIMIKYDTLWRFLGAKDLGLPGRFPTGVVCDGQRFYIDYLDINYPNNIHLAAFDRDWNLLQDIHVTNETDSTFLHPDSPFLIQHDDLLYASYTVDSIDPVTRAERRRWQAFVNIYKPLPLPAGIAPEHERIKTAGVPADLTLLNNGLEVSIRSKAFVKIKLMDISGRELSTIISEELQAGKYLFKCNFIHFSRGIIFARITAGNFSVTKTVVSSN